MKSEQTNNPVTGVPKQVFDQFLKKLEDKKIASDVIMRLKETLIGQGDMSDTAMKAALFLDNDTNT
ncbi:hypothetical protein MYX07_04330 [Patescibacteria group bacterium AH-259-L07]|nr:hypothetical protein [Patescibacteria group bacterium AH-259-L07]